MIGYSVHIETAFVPSREIIAANNREQLRIYIQSLQRLLINFAAYRFHCKLTLNISLSYAGSTNVFMSLRKSHKGTMAQQNFQFNSQIAIKEKLKQAVTNLAQPLLMDLNPCLKCYIKHYKQECMRFMCPQLTHVNLKNSGDELSNYCRFNRDYHCES